ncbi:MAG: nucleotidyltransferase family protein [Pseudomonadota bacterium]
MRPSLAFEQNRTAIRALLQRYRADNPRVFGSVLSEGDHEGSDLDLLIDPQPGVTLFDLGGLQDELESLLGIRVDVLTPKDLPVHFRQQVLAEARAL